MAIASVRTDGRQVISNAYMHDVNNKNEWSWNSQTYYVRNMGKARIIYKYLNITYAKANNTSQ